MQALELIDENENKLIQNAGSIIAAGQSQKSKEVVVKTMTAQYPAERAAAIDTVDTTEVSALYQNGILFTAYEYTSRVTPDMRNARMGQLGMTKTQRVLNGITTALQSVAPSKSNNKSEIMKAPVANILMPRSKTDSDITSHKFNDVGESLMTRGNNSATGILSNLASTAVFGAIESATQGIMADHGEQIYNTARSMYAGPDNRNKTYTWDLTPRTPEDLTQIVKIFEIFNYFSHGIQGNSAFAKQIKEEIDNWYKKTFIKPINEATGTTSKGSTAMESVTSFLSNVITVSNPTVWFIQNFGTQSKFDGLADVFGPAQISNIRFDKSPDGNFNGLAIAPNMPSTFVLEVTFREILTLNRASIYGESVL